MRVRSDKSLGELEKCVVLKGCERRFVGADYDFGWVKVVAF